MSYLDELFSVAGKKALVTGGATGIGRMAATALVEAGADVMIASRKGEDCEKVAAELNALGASGKAEGFAGDVGSEEGVTALSGEVKKRTEGLDILINNAGLSWGAPLEEFPYSAWARVLNVNVTGLFHLTRELLPLLTKSARFEDPSRIINLGSVMGTQLHRLEGSCASSDPHARQRVRGEVHHRQRLRTRPLPEPHDGICDRYRGEGRDRGKPCAASPDRGPE